MASNPLQKKSRNSFLLGIIITLLITGGVIAILLMQIQKMNKEKKEEEALNTEIYALNTDIKSGQVVTEDMLSILEVKTTTIPANAIIDAETLGNYALIDAEGNNIYTDKKGLYIVKETEYLELYDETDLKDLGLNGEYEEGYYTFSAKGELQKVTLSTREKDNIKTDDYGKYIVRQTTDKTRIYKEENTDNYYKLKINYYGTDINKENPMREKEYIKLNGTALIAKIDMEQNTILTLEMLAKSDEPLTDDMRRQEYNCLVLPLDLETGHYVDVRLMLPNGQDYIVVSKKQVEIPKVTSSDGEDGWGSTNTVWLNLGEDEILTMSCAIVDAFKITGAKLYVTIYTDPGMQEASQPTYLINSETAVLIQKDPNVLEQALTELKARYNGSDRNTYIDSEIVKQDTEGRPNNADSNYIQNMQESIKSTQEQRKEYLETLES